MLRNDMLPTSIGLLGPSKFIQNIACELFLFYHWRLDFSLCLISAARSPYILKISKSHS